MYRIDDFPQIKHERSEIGYVFETFASILKDMVSLLIEKSDGDRFLYGSTLNG